MAMSVGNGGNGRGRYRPLSEINITPMVDVMLVLLIIFMVTAPLMTSSINVNLPKASATPTNTDAKPLNVSINADGKVYLQNEPVTLDELVVKLKAIEPTARDRRIFVRGDKANSYGTIVKVLGVIIDGGFTKVALLTDPAGAPNGTNPDNTKSGAAPDTKQGSVTPDRAARSGGESAKRGG